MAMQDPMRAMDPTTRDDADDPPPNPPYDTAGPQEPGAEDPRPDDPNEPPLDERITRFLCATAHLDASYADHVVDTLLSPGRQALGPAWEIDPVALAAHASLSQRRRLERDGKLRVVLAGMIAAALFVLVASVLRIIDWRWLAASFVLIPVGGWLLAFNIVMGHYRVVRAAALDVFSAKRKAAESAPPLAPDDEARLRALHRANVVIFEGFLPFVGSGVTLDTWRLTIDLSRPAGGTAEGNGARTAVNLDADDLHRHLLSENPPLALTGVRAYRRLYVDGGTAPSVPGLIPDDPSQCRRPPSIVGPDLLDEYSSRPTRTARTYLCFVKSGWNGDVVVTMFIRAEVNASTLFVEGRSHVLLPLQSGFKDIGWVSKNADKSWRPIASAAAANTSPLLMESWGRKMAAVQGGRKGAQRLEDEGETIALGQPVQYGTSTSLREEAQVVRDLQYYASVDEIMYFKVMTRQVLLSLERFLSERGLAGPEFEEQRLMIITQTFNVHGIQGNAVVGSANAAVAAGS